MDGDYIGTVTCTHVSLTQTGSTSGVETYNLKSMSYAAFEKAAGA